MAKAKATQETIRGTDSRPHPEVHKAALDYLEVRDQRMALTEDEVGARGNLVQAMRSAGLETYLFREGETRYRVTLEPGEATVKVRTVPEPKAAAG